MDRIGFVRKFFVAVASIALVLALPNAARAEVGVTINGNGVNVWPPPILQGDHVFVPLRGVFQDLGASVVYSNGQINATDNGIAISLSIGSTQATVNGSPVTIDVAPFIAGESTYVPLRFVSEALGATVSWDDGTQTVDIGYSGSTANAQQVESPPEELINQPPPPIPSYEPPPVPAPNFVWVPGYWAWGYPGYYWVPGTWVQAPQVGLLWTPGYWSWQLGNFGWHPGYWANQIGFYGGINYGGGYYGNGFVGGNWAPNGFRYNTAVFPVKNTTVITNVYVNKTVIINNTSVNRISYNGGPHGIAAQPNAHELAVAKLPHVAMTTVQAQHAAIAGSDRRSIQSVNAGKPAVVVAPHPYTPAAKPKGLVPVTPQDRAPLHPTAAPLVNHPAAPPLSHAAPPVSHALPVITRTVQQAPVYHAPPAPVYHQPVIVQPVATRAPVPPRAVQAPVYHAPVAPVYHAPVAPVIHPKPTASAPRVTPTPPR